MLTLGVSEVRLIAWRAGLLAVNNDGRRRWGRANHGGSRPPIAVL
jgi:hypothetical protein